jgi:hypothetical protein
MAGWGRVRLGTAGLVWIGWERLGRRGKFRRGQVGNGRSRRARFGMASQGKVWRDAAGGARCDTARWGMLRPG